MKREEFAQALDYLYGLQKFGIKFGLSSTENLLRRLGNPESRLQVIHVAGTNGKGSTAAMIAAILGAAGYEVGLYTSPHLVRFNERYRLNDREVADEDLLSSYQRVRAVVDEREPPTFFEMTTAMAFDLFARKNVDWLVLEVGMGGRLDATNVVKPAITVITNVSLEHRQYLGATLSAIAREKAGIIKPGVPLVTAARQPQVLAVINARCQQHGAPCFRVGRHFRVRARGSAAFSYWGLGWRLRHLPLPMAGSHQVVNGATAIGTLEVLSREGMIALPGGAIAVGLRRTKWPGRLEKVQERPLVLLDGAHNPAGVRALCRSLAREFDYARLLVVFGVMADKDVRATVTPLAQLADHLILTRPQYERAADPLEVRRLLSSSAANKKVEVVPAAAAAVGRALELAREEDLVVITGSLYFIGEIKEMEARLFGEAKETAGAGP